MARLLSTLIPLALALLLAPVRVAAEAPVDIPRDEVVLIRPEVGMTVEGAAIQSALTTLGPATRAPALDLPAVGWQAWWTPGRRSVLPSGLGSVPGVAAAWRPASWEIPTAELQPRAAREPMVVAGGGLRDPEQEPFWAQLWNLRAIRAYPDGWNAATGLLSRVAVIDTGVDCTHVDLRCVEADHYDATKRMQVGVPTDRLGHGTHVAGIIAAVENGRGVIGVAPDAEIYSCKACSDGGTCNELDVAACIVWGVGIGDVDVMNMSLGGPGGANTPELCEVLAWARGNGVFTVASVGNAGSRQQLWPATCGGVVGVGATIPPDGDRLAEYSQRASVDLSAPGSEVLSTLPNGRWGYLSGTSMAAPHVSGAAALMREAMGDEWDPDRAATILYDNARRICGPIYQSALCGWGALDVNEALRSWLPTVPTRTASPTGEPIYSTPTVEATPTQPTATATATHIPAVQTAIARMTQTAEPTATAAPTGTDEATNTPRPTWTALPTRTPAPSATLDPVAATVTALWPTATPNVEATLTALAPTPDRVATAVWATLRAPAAATRRAESRLVLFFPLLIGPSPATETPTPTRDACLDGAPWECPEKTLVAQVTQTLAAQDTATAEAEATYWAWRTPSTPTPLWPLGRRLPITTAVHHTAPGAPALRAPGRD